MYSGTTFHKLSGNIIGAHQKIDRVARNQLNSLIPGNNFPRIGLILKFEGNRGPDSIKRKSPGKNEEWHFIKPSDPNDTKLIEIICYHYDELVSALKSKNLERSSFEAAWLAHAIVDGLTPAHHYPYEQELIKLREGEGIETRSSIIRKLIIPGRSSLNIIKNNWQMWGPKGLFSMHAAFELGFATLIAPLRFNDILPKPNYLSSISKMKLPKWYRSLVSQVDKLNIYETYYKTGWTRKLSKQVRKELAPTLINAVTAVWYLAYNEAINKDNTLITDKS